MSLVGKPRPGVCDVCGHAVMRAVHEPRDGHANGHSYKNGKLVSVHCRDHGGSLWEDPPGVPPIIDCFGGYIPGPRIVPGKE